MVKTVYFLLFWKVQTSDIVPTNKDFYSIFTVCFLDFLYVVFVTLPRKNWGDSDSRPAFGGLVAQQTEPLCGLSIFSSPSGHLCTTRRCWGTEFGRRGPVPIFLAPCDNQGQTTWACYPLLGPWAAWTWTAPPGVGVVLWRCRGRVACVVPPSEGWSRPWCGKQDVTTDF